MINFQIESIDKIEIMVIPYFNRFAKNMHIYCKTRMLRFKKLIRHLRNVGWRWTGDWLNGFKWARDKVSPSLTRVPGISKEFLSKNILPYHTKEIQIHNDPIQKEYAARFDSDSEYDPIYFKVGVVDKYVGDHPTTAHEAKKVCQAKFTCVDKVLERRKWEAWAQRFKRKYNITLIGIHEQSGINQRRRMEMEYSGKIFGDVYDFQGLENPKKQKHLLSKLEWVAPEYIYDNPAAARRRSGTPKSIIQKPIDDWMRRDLKAQIANRFKKSNITKIKGDIPYEFTDTESGVIQLSYYEFDQKVNSKTNEVKIVIRPR